jgi:hypothetical protein
MLGWRCAAAFRGGMQSNLTGHAQMKAVPCTGPCIFIPLLCRRPGAGESQRAPRSLTSVIVRAGAAAGPARPRITACSGRGPLAARSLTRRRQGSPALSPGPTPPKTPAFRAGITPGNSAKPLARAPAPPRPREQRTSRRHPQVAAPCLSANQACFRSCHAMETQEQPAVAVGLLYAPTDATDAAATGPSSSAPPPPLPPPLAAAECKPEGDGDMLSQDDTNLLFLLANIANGDDNEEQGGARARCVPATSAILARLLGSLLPFLVPLPCTVPATGSRLKAAHPSLSVPGCVQAWSTCQQQRRQLQHTESSGQHGWRGASGRAAPAPRRRAAAPGPAPARRT